MNLHYSLSDRNMRNHTVQKSLEPSVSNLTHIENELFEDLIWLCEHLRYCQTLQLH